MSKLVYTTIETPTGEKDYMDIEQVSALIIPSSYVDVASGYGQTKTIHSKVRYDKDLNELAIISSTEDLEVKKILDQEDFVNALSDNAHNKKNVFDKIEYVQTFIEANKASIIKKLSDNGTLFTNVLYEAKVIILNNNSPIAYYESLLIEKDGLHLNNGKSVAALETVEYDRIIVEIGDHIYEVDMKGFELKNGVDIVISYKEINKLDEPVAYEKRENVKNINRKETYQFEETWEDDVNKIIRVEISEDECDIDDFDDLF